MNLFSKKNLDLISYVISSLLLAVITMIFNFSIVNGLSISEYSKWSYQVGVALIIFSMLIEWVRVSVIRLGVKNFGWWMYARFIVLTNLFFVCLVLLILFFIFDVDCLIIVFYLVFHIAHESYLACSRVLNSDAMYRKVQYLKSFTFAIGSFLLYLGFYSDSGVNVSLFVVLFYIVTVLLFSKYTMQAVTVRKSGSQLRLRRFKVFFKFGAPLIIVSASSLSIFYIDRIMLKILNNGGLIAESAAISDFVRQLLVFPINLISIYFYNKEVFVFNSKVSELRRILIIKFSTFTFVYFSIFCCLFLGLDIISKFYFPEEYVEYWEGNWIYFFLAYAVFAIKVYFFDQYFLLIKKTQLVAIISFFLLVTYVLVMYIQSIFGEINVGLSFLYSNLIIVFICLVFFYNFNARGDN